MGKYGSKKVRITDSGSDHVFDSKLEGRRFLFLQNKQKKGLIRNLEIQVSFEVIPATAASRKTTYIADFVYDEYREYQVKDKLYKFWVHIVEDTKGVKQEVFKIKHKLMLWKFERESLPWIFRITYDFEGNDFEDTWITDNNLINYSSDTGNPKNYFYISSNGTIHDNKSQTFLKAWKKDQEGEWVPGTWKWKY
jgi:hypothetical protein